MRTALRVFYPLQPHQRLALRTELDWSTDVLPVASGDTWADFDIDTHDTRGHLYYKAVLWTDGALRWAQGNNSLMTAPVPHHAHTIYPFFHGGAGSLTPRQALAGPDGTWEVRIYLPPGYRENTLKRYPVLYANDGANLFLPDEAFGRSEWRLDETVSLLNTMNVINKVIVVGIYARDRMTDYTAPGYARYGRFLVDTLVPFVDARLRTLADPEHRVVAGSSLGGVVSLHAAWGHPETFGGAWCLSSTFGYRDDLLSRIQAHPQRIRVYLDSGWPGDNYEANRIMVHALLDAGLVWGRDLLYFAFPGAQHNEAAWAQRIHLPFQFAFGRASRRGLL